MDNYVIESPVEDFIITDIDDSGKLYFRIMQDISTVADVFREKIEIRNRNLAFKKGDQWTDAEIAAHHEQFREPFVFNEIQSKIDHLVGTQTQTRLDARLIGREKGDAAGAELLSFLLKWAEQINYLEYTETDVFEESLYGGASATVVRWEMEELEYGYPAVEKIPINELFWDINSRRLDLKDARWQARVCYRTKLEVEEQYPAFVDIIKNASVSNNSSIYARFSQIQNERQQQMQFASQQRADDSGRELVLCVEHYEKLKRYKYVINDEILGVQNEFEELEKAQAFYSGVEDQYISQGTQLLNNDGTPRIQLLATSTDIILQTVIVGDKVLYTSPMRYPYFPYVLNFAYFNEGDYWGFVDCLISPQKLVNRYLSQWDYQLGASTKSAITVVESLLKKGFGITQAQEELSKTAPLLPVLQHNAFQAMPNQPVNPELFQGINVGIARMNDYTGGKNVLGMQENAAESGRAVLARAEMGGVGRLPFFDKLRFWRKQISERLIWLIKNFMPTGQVLRIIGASGDVEYVEIDDELIDSLMEIRYDIAIDEVQKSESIKQSQFQTLKEMFAVMQVPMEVALPYMLELSPIPESIKRRITENIQSYQTFMQQQAQQQKEQKLSTEVQDSLFKQMLRSQATQQEEIQAGEAEVQRRQQNLKTKLDDIERAKMEQQQQNLSPTDTSNLFDKLRTPEELSQANPAMLAGLKQ